MTDLAVPVPSPADAWPTPDQAVALARRLTNPAFISVAESDVGLPRDSDEGPLGPLSGVPFAVKDNIDVAGLPTTGGCPALTAPAAHNAVAVERLVLAGAVPIGKTNLDQFATGLVGTRTPYGACHSVYSPDHVSGGSSSGSAVAVAAGVVPFALGTDTAGSGRVPAAFNGIVGIKPSRGLVSVVGVMPTSASLDCVSVFSRTVALGRRVLETITGFETSDPWSRRPPAVVPGVARVMSVLGVPHGPLDLDAPHRQAWNDVLHSLEGRIRLVPVDVTPMLEAARLLYEPALVAERLTAFGHLLEPDGPHLDPVVRGIVLGARGVGAEEVFRIRLRLVGLARETEQVLAGVDGVLLPTTPFHPTLHEVAREPVGVNSRLGTYTNMVNLLDLCAVALPLGLRHDGLPFGVQLIAPAFADIPLLETASMLMGESQNVLPDVRAGRTLLAVCGAHLSGEPLNPVLTGSGARLYRRARTAPGYRMVRIEGRLPRPGLVDEGTGPADGIDLEVWEVPEELVGTLTAEVDRPLTIGHVRLEDDSVVLGFVADPDEVRDANDISLHGSWRSHVRAAR